MSDLRVRNFSAEAEGGEEDTLDFSKPDGGSGDSAAAPEGEQDIVIGDEGGEADKDAAENGEDIVLTDPLEEEKSGEKPTEEEKSGEKPTDKSSLEPEPKVEDSPAPVVPAITDDSALKYLNEKLGKNFKSLEEVNAEPAKAENPLDSDPYLKSIYEWRQRTGRPIQDFLKYQQDTSNMSDIDAARVLIADKYPTFSEEDIELELSQYIPEEYEEERSAAIKNLELKKLATSGRELLAKNKAELDTPSEQLFAPEIKEKIQFAEAAKESMARQQAFSKEYSENILSKTAATDVFEIKLSDDLKIDFKIPEQGKKEIPTLIDEMPHWHNEDGTWNHQAVVNDAIKVKYFDDMMKLAFEQGESSGIEKAVKTGNNITLDQAGATDRQSNIAKGVQIEGLEEQLGSTGTKLRFFKK